jgi:hypothetical protein
LTYI